MKNKTNKKKLMIFVLSLGVIAIAATTTFSWFYFFKDAGIKFGDSIKVNVGAKLETKLSSEDETKWTNSITLNEQREDLLDITGDGKDFFYPTSLDDSNTPRGYQHIGEGEGGQGYYIELSLDFRASIAMDLYLNNTSKVKESASFNASIFNEKLDANAICGATRVAFLEKTVDVNNQVNEELKCIWIPNDDYYLYYDETDYNLPKIHTGDVSNREDAYYYYGYDSEGNEKLCNYTVDDYLSGKVIVGNTLANETTNSFGYNKPLLSLDNQSVKTLIIRLWFEGTDRECVAELSQGSISYQFDFFGAKYKDAQTNVDSLNSIVGSGHLDDNLVYLYTDDTLTSQPTGIEYSVDGIIWSEYTNQSFDKTKISQVYLRLKETEKLLPSETRILNLQTINLDKSDPDLTKLNAIVGSGSTTDKMISFYSDDSLASRPEGVEYSVDNGATWQDYVDQSFNQETTETVYLRLKETDIYLASDPRIVDMKSITLVEPTAPKGDETNENI